jgi:hypothetical protein
MTHATAPIRPRNWRRRSCHRAWKHDAEEPKNGDDRQLQLHRYLFFFRFPLKERSMRFLARHDGVGEKVTLPLLRKSSGHTHAGRGPAPGGGGGFQKRMRCLCRGGVGWGGARSAPPPFPPFGLARTPHRQTPPSQGGLSRTHRLPSLGYGHRRVPSSSTTWRSVSSRLTFSLSFSPSRFLED